VSAWLTLHQLIDADLKKTDKNKLENNTLTIVTTTHQLIFKGIIIIIKIKFCIYKEKEKIKDKMMIVRIC